MRSLVIKYLLAILILVTISSCDTNGSKNEITLFISGLGDDNTARWQKIKPVMQENGMKFGGQISPNTPLNDITYLESGFFFAKMTDTQSSVSNQIDDLAQIIHKIKNRLGSEIKINLVGYSLGGVIARGYIVTIPDPNIIRLITIASPHRGSNWAYFWDIKNAFNTKCLGYKKNDFSSNEIHNFICNIDFFSKIENRLKIKIDSDALKDIRPYDEDDIEKYLFYLNQKTHPDIEYYSITARVEPVKDLDELIESVKQTRHAIVSGEKLNKSSAKLITFFRQAVFFPKIFFNSDIEAWVDGGDGAVNYQSQQIANIDYFNKKRYVTKKALTHEQQESEIITLIGHNNKIYNYTFFEEFHYGTLDNKTILELIAGIVNH